MRVPPINKISSGPSQEKKIAKRRFDPKKNVRMFNGAIISIDNIIKYLPRKRSIPE
jgi:hypothetical protein